MHSTIVWNVLCLQDDLRGEGREGVREGRSEGERGKGGREGGKE